MTMKTSKQKGQILLWPVIVAFLAGALVGGMIGAVSGIFLFIRTTGGTAEPSVPISAPTLALPTVADVAEEPTATEEVVAVAEPTAVIDPTATLAPATEVPTETPEPTPSPVLYRIVPEESQAQFAVEETFPAGIAVGTTNQIAGDILVDFSNPANSQVGTIRINLRTLQTDDADRDSSIRCCVLKTVEDRYEFTDFVPTQIIGLPETITVGETVVFQLVGDLTLLETTKPATFDVTVTVTDENTLSGRATTVVTRSDYGLLVEAYHGVFENVDVSFDFVARAVNE